MNNFLSYFLLSKVEKKALINIFLITLFAMSSILLANILYSDDLTRVVTGQTFWNDNGRPLSSLISVLLQLGTPLTDISPFPQLLAFGIYSLSAVYLGKLFQVDNLSLLTLSGLIFVLNPFNLQNFIFVFDSFPMALAVLTSTMAALSVSLYINQKDRKKKQWLSLSLSLVFLVFSLCLYQSGTSVYIVTCTFYTLIKLLNQDIQKSITLFFTSISILIFSLIGYIPIKNHYVNNEYNLYHSKIISLTEAPYKIINNIKYFWRNIQYSLGEGSVIYILIYSLFILTLLVILFRAIYIKKRTNSKFILKSRTQYLLYYICLIFYLSLLIVTPAGLMVLLENPVFLPRTMMGFSTLVAICCLFLSKQFFQKIYQYPFKYGLISFFFILILAFSNVSLTLGNVIYSQNIQDNIIATMLVSDISKVAPQISQVHPKVAIVNSLDYSYVNAKAHRKYPILNSITWYYIKTNQIHFYKKLETLGFKFDSPNYITQVFTGKNNQFYPTTDAALNGPLYTIYFENPDLLVVVLKNPNNK